MKTFPCDSYRDIITDSQNSLCSINPYIMSAAVMGLRRALGACSILFGSDRFGSTCWNCTLYAHRYLLGQAIEATHEYTSVCTHTKHGDTAAQGRCQGALVVVSLYDKSCMHACARQYVL